MSMYARYMKDPDGFRRLVELLETTPLKRREELIASGMREDADYTKMAMEYILTFQDILQLPEMELTEVICSMKPRSVAFCIFKADETLRERFLKCVPRDRIVEVNSYLDMNPSPTDAGQSKKEAIVAARHLEQKGLLSIKKIPKNVSTKEVKQRSREEKKRLAAIISQAKSADVLEMGNDLFSDNLFGGEDESAEAQGEKLIGYKKAK